MTAPHRLTPHAAEGVVRIVGYVDEHFGPDVAARVIDELEHAFEALALGPQLGHRRTDLTLDERVQSGRLGRR